MAARHKLGARERAEVARVLLVDGDIATRLTLQAVLKASGYAVDSAASVPEALDKLEKEQYALVLCGVRPENQEECRRVIDHARAQDYKPATALLTASGGEGQPARGKARSNRVLIEPLDVPDLLTKIADLLADRAADRERRNMRRRHLQLVAAD